MIKNYYNPFRATQKHPSLLRRKYLIFGLFCLLVFSSCTRNLTYFSNLEQETVLTENVTETPPTHIQPDDILNITVSSLNPEANNLFNIGVMPNVNASEGGNYRTINDVGFLVDHDGYIEYPVIGKIQLGGLTKEEAKSKLQEELKIYLKDPVIRIRFQNYRITVIGEVKNPSTFVLPSEKINILTALGMAGDMTAFGKRDNVLLIREKDGLRTIARLNLNDKEVLNSPYFYLQQNDIIYVEPVTLRGPEWGNNLRIVSIIASLASIVSLIIFRFN